MFEVNEKDYVMGYVAPDEDDVEHYGILRKSGRFPWGSGEDPLTRSQTFLSTIAEMRKSGMSDTDIAKAFSTDEHPYTTTQLRETNTIARNQKKAADITTATRMKYERGLSNVEIGKRMGINESSVRALLAPAAKDRADVLSQTSDVLRRAVEDRGFVDVGAGTELHLGVSPQKLGSALAMLKSEGYVVEKIQEDQLGTTKKTTIKVLAPPGTTYRDIVTNKDKIQLPIGEYTNDGGRNFTVIQPPLAVSAKRVGVKYKEEGGAAADGVIYVRPGVKDISLGGTPYAQVRIAVSEGGGHGSGTHYLKGMAIYKDDLPKGVDLLFNTNKSDTGNKFDAMKEIKRDKDTGKVIEDNPFGAIVRQIKDASGNPISAMNIVGSKEGAGEEGGWEKWSKNLPSQFLSKQNPKLVKQQLDMAYERSKNELDTIMKLTNPAVRAKLLESYSDGADSAAIHLKAAALPRQGTHVILPVPEMSPTKIYAPKFRPGEPVVLVRFPHGGKFEIPELEVDNENPAAKKLLGNARDAVGIHPDVAARLSGADFDGDTVLVIPNRGVGIKSEPALSGLKNFDPKEAYKPYHGMKTIDGGVYNADTKKVEYGKKGPSPRGKGMQMGLVSNLITDMTIKGAPNSELERAVKHSMVVIDAEKHVLDYKESARQNGIAALMKKYQGRSGGGASTLISNSGVKSTVEIPERRERRAKDGGPIDKATGRKVYEDTGASYVDRKTGKTVYKTEKVPKLGYIDDLMDTKYNSHTPVEDIYATHGNRMKALANEARREMVNTKPRPYSPAAKKAYAEEVKSLNAKLDLAIRNKPLERQAQLIGNHIYRAKVQASPDMDGDEKKKLKALALTTGRARAGAGKDQINITDEEWKAIQAGAISPKRLKDILDNADQDRVRELATPRVKVLMTSAKTQTARNMLANGYSLSDVADHLGVSVSTLTESMDSQKEG